MIDQEERPAGQVTDSYPSPLPKRQDPFPENANAWLPNDFKKELGMFLSPDHQYALKYADASLSEAVEMIQSALHLTDKKFDDEDLPIKDYLSESRSLTKEQSILESDIREAHFVQNANRSMASTDWQRSVNSFVDLNPDFSSAIMQGALNAALNELYADETNLGSSHNWYLQIAARAVIEHISPAQAASEALPDGNDNDAAVNAAKGAATRSNDAKAKLPKTLGDLAPADEVGTEKGKFDDLDSLSGVELEARLSLMTPEQEQEYLRAE